MISSPELPGSLSPGCKRLRSRHQEEGCRVQMSPWSGTPLSAVLPTLRWGDEG